jgi:hypothetical protein
VVSETIAVMNGCYERELAKVNEEWQVRNISSIVGKTANLRKFMTDRRFEIDIEISNHEKGT